MSELPRPHRPNLTLTLGLAIGLALSMTTVTWAETELRQCKRRVRTTELIGNCSTTGIDIDHPITSDLQIDNESINLDNGLTCTFRFSSFGGSFFTPDQLPRDITVEGGESREATAWYLCSGGACQSDHCPFDTEVYGIDISSSTFVPQPFVEDVAPVAATGNCLTNSPCATTDDVHVSSVTARRSVAGLEFVSWFGQTAGNRTRNNPPPGGVEIAFYRETEPSTCSFSTLNLAGLRPCRPLDPEGILDIHDLERPWALELDRICHYVLNCPGCGPFGLCAPFGWTFDGEGIEHLQVLLHDRLTGKVLAKGKANDKGGQTVWFTPEKGELGRYFFSFVPTKPDAKADGARLRIRLDVSPKH